MWVAMLFVIGFVSGIAMAEDAVYCKVTCHAWSAVEQADGDYVLDGVGWDRPVIINPVIKGDRMYIPKGLYLDRWDKNGAHFFFADTMVRVSGTFYRMKSGLKSLPVYSRKIDTKGEIREERPLPYNRDLPILGEVQKKSDGWKLVLEDSSEYNVPEDKADYDSREKYVLLRDLEEIHASVPSGKREFSTERYIYSIPPEGLKVYAPHVEPIEGEPHSYTNYGTRVVATIDPAKIMQLTGLKLDWGGEKMVIPSTYSFGTPSTEAAKRDDDHTKAEWYVWRAEMTCKNYKP
jgi:hypothetical protein